MKKLNDGELLEAFPEAKQVIPALLKDFKQQHDTLVTVIADRLTAIKTESFDESYQYFWRKWLAATFGEQLQAIDRHIARLYRQLHLAEGRPAIDGSLTDDMIQAAREVLIEELLEQPLNRSGHDLVCVCPFHQEHTPSFRIYTQENRGWCFGCNQGGDPISIYMSLNDCGFKEAVTALIGGKK